MSVSRARTQLFIRRSCRKHRLTNWLMWGPNDSSESSMTPRSRTFDDGWMSDPANLTWSLLRWCWRRWVAHHMKSVFAGFNFRRAVHNNCFFIVLMMICAERSMFLSFFFSHFVVSNANKAVFQHSRCIYRITATNHTDKPKVTALTNTYVRLKSQTIPPSSIYCNSMHPETSAFKQQLRAATFK